MTHLFKFTILVLFLANIALACRPIFRLWESRGYGNDYVEMAVEYVTITEERDTMLHGIEGDRTRTCPVGLWMGYQYDRWQGRTTLYTGREGGVRNINCQQQGGVAYHRSLKIVGHPDDYTKSAVVTYMDIWNQWIDTTYLNDTAELPVPVFKSMILTGNEEVELFTETNFQGASVCIGPNNGQLYYRWEFDERNHLRNGTELYTSLLDMQVLVDRIEFHSLRFGCGAKHTS